MTDTHSDNKVVVLDDREHVLTVPSRYIGSTSIKDIDDYVFNGERIETQPLRVVPAFMTLLREVVSNSVDENTRTKGDFADKIDVSLGDDGSFTVSDNGRGISHEPAVDSVGNSVGLPQSVVAFTKTKAGTNFGEKTEAIGQNGEGVSLVNIFSKHFAVETHNGSKCTRIECRDNMSDVDWKITATRKRGTSVTWLPDYERLNVSRDVPLLESYGPYIHKMILDMSMCYPRIKFSWNGARVDAKSFKNYVSLYGIEGGVVATHENVDIAVYPSYDFAQASWINGVYTRRGGMHVEVVMHCLVKEFRELLSKKYSEIKPADIRNKLFVLVSVRNMKGPRFDSQTKEELINTDDFESELFADVDFAAIAKKMKANKEITDNVTEAFRIKEELKKRKRLEDKQKKLERIAVPKLIESYERDRSKCRLYLAEGQSAVKEFLTSRRPEFAAYPLRGKFINCMEVTRDRLLKNEEVSDLLAVTGLKLTSREVDDLRYGDGIIIFTDADYDGDSICCLLLAFFYKFWPELFRRGLVKRAVTPLVSAKNLDTGETRYFFSMGEWKEAHDSGNWKMLGYNKGLGGLSPEEYAFSLDNIVTITEDAFAIDSLEMAFKKGADARQRRKDWLMGGGL